MEKQFLIWGLTFGVAAIVLGAFGAHALQSILTEQQLNSFETGVRYQFYHALLLLILSQVTYLRNKRTLILFIIGIICFSFSIYLLSLKDYFECESLKILGPITPIGGMLLIIGWGTLLLKVIQYKNNKE